MATVEYIILQIAKHDRQEEKVVEVTQYADAALSHRHCMKAEGA